jgi:hypothetical protein
MKMIALTLNVSKLSAYALLKDQKMLLAQLRWELPPQAPPRITQTGPLVEE